LDPKLAQSDNSSIWSIVFSPSGSFFVTADNRVPADICIWNSNKGRRLWKLNPGLDGGDKLAISKNERYLAYGNRRTIKIWDVTTHKPVSTLRGHNPTAFFYQTDITGVEFLPDNKRILSGSIDNDVRVWDIKTGKCLRVYHNPYKSGLGAESILFDNDRNTIVAGYCGYILGWDVNTNKITYRLEDDSIKMGCVNKLHKLDENRFLSVGFGDQKTNCRIWDLQAKRLTRRFYIKFSWPTISISPDKKYIATAFHGDDPVSLKIWDLSTGTLLHELGADVAKIYNLAWSPGGHELVSGSVDGTLIMWNVPQISK
jgi:WD40 repeat protein